MNLQPNISKLVIMFASPNLLTEKEEPAYPLGSLVADCGGVLGMFVGFNFLMVWDFLSIVFVKVQSSVQK